jgi:hypothetical protein
MEKEHQRGEYDPHVVAAASPEVTGPWRKFAIGTSLLLGVVGVGYALTRVRASTDWPERSVPKIREAARAAGIKPWMSQTEMERLWNAYNAKHGRPSTAR